jgi:hypothetical protein
MKPMAFANASDEYNSRENPGYAHTYESGG